MTTTLTLNNGVTMPSIGLGVFQSSPEDTVFAVRTALYAGYRHIDRPRRTATSARSARRCATAGFPRGRLLGDQGGISDYGYEETLHAWEKSASKLGVEQIDLLILHQPLPSRFDLTVAAYRALQTLLERGTVRAIGVANFSPQRLAELLAQTDVVPALNQIELHPYVAQRASQACDAEHGVLTQAWSPIGGITFYWAGEGAVHRILDDPALGAIAAAHGKSAAQVILRWHVQQGRSAIPKSVRPARIAENIDVFDLELSAEELTAIDLLDSGGRTGNPDDITLDNTARQIPEA